MVDWHAALDIAQETRVRLWQQFDEYDPNKDFGAWARTIAHYEVLHYRTRLGRKKERFSDDVLEAVANEMSRVAERTDPRQTALSECLDGLTVEQRQCVMGCYQGDRTIRQVASEQGKSYEGLRKSVLRIRKLLRACIEKKIGDEDSP